MRILRSMMKRIWTNTFYKHEESAQAGFFIGNTCLKRGQYSNIRRLKDGKY